MKYLVFIGKKRRKAIFKNTHRKAQTYRNSTKILRENRQV